jgi:hypothetical protein
MAEHLPVNHPLLRFYRLLAGVAGLYVLAFGILGLIETWGTSLFGREDTWVLGLRTNLAFSLLSVVVGAVVLVGALAGGNADRYINLAGGVIFLLSGMAMMTVLQTDANLLNFTIATCVVSFIIGVVLGTAGLYGKVGSAEERSAEEAFRHGGYDPKTHAWQKEQKPQGAELNVSGGG